MLAGAGHDMINVRNFIRMNQNECETSPRRSGAFRKLVNFARPPSAPPFFSIYKWKFLIYHKVFHSEFDNYPIMIETRQSWRSVQCF